MIAVNRFLLFTVAAFFGLAGYAQKAKLEWGDLEKKSKSAPYLVRILKGNSDELITVSFKGDAFSLGKAITPVLARFDNNLNQVMERELFTSEKNVSYHSVHNFKGNIFLFTRQYDGDEKYTTLQATQIDPVTLQASTSKALSRFDAISKRKQADITIKPSSDTSSILVFAEAPYNKNENERFYISVWDNKMNKQWDKMISMPYADKYITVEGFDVSNDGEVYVMCKHYDKEVTRERVRENGESVPSYKYKILIYGKNDKSPREYTLDFQDKFVHDVALQFNSDGNVSMMGLYKDKYNGYVSGAFITMLDKSTKKITVKKMEAFTNEEFLELIDKDDCGRSSKKDPGLSYRFKVIGTNKRNDGSVDLLTECNYMYMVTTYYNNMYTTYPVYVANDIVVINFKKDGQVVYTRIPKKQSESNTRVHLSFKWMNQGKDLFLFYNDDKDNIDRDLAKKPDAVRRFSKSSFVMAVVDEKGGLRRVPAFSNDDLEVITEIPSCETVTADALIIYAERARVLSKTKYQFGRLKLL